MVRDFSKTVSPQLIVNITQTTIYEGLLTMSHGILECPIRIIKHSERDLLRMTRKFLTPKKVQ